MTERERALLRLRDAARNYGLACEEMHAAERELVEAATALGVMDAAHGEKEQPR